MAMQTGIGFSKILILAGAGYTSTILFKNGKLSDLVGELQTLVKGLENSGEKSDGNADLSDAIAAQVHRLAMEVRQLASSRQITVLNGSSSNDYSSLIVPTATVGALGYGYMWWKGISFADMMYVTKRNMATAVTNLTKHLDQVSEALSAAKRHLTQRIQIVDDKMDKQNELSKGIQESVALAREDLSSIDYDLDALRKMIMGLDGKIDSLEYKQDVANVGVRYLCSFIAGKNGKLPEVLKEENLRLSGNFKAHKLLLTAETPSVKGLIDIVDSLAGDDTGALGLQDGITSLEKPKSSILRSSSIR